MTNILKPKTGTSAPSTSDIVDGEMAIDRSNQKLYLRDGVSIKEIGGSSASGDITAVVAGTGLSGGATSGSATLTTNDGAIVHDNLSGFVAAEHINWTSSSAGSIHSSNINFPEHRTITAGGNTLANSETLAFTAGSNVTITETGGAVTITSLAGDITGVTAGTGLSGGGSSGSVTLTVDAAQTQITSVGTIGTGVWQGTAIASGYIAADAINSSKIADNSINSEHYVDGSIDNAHIADDAINSEHYAALSIDAAHISADAIVSSKIADNSINSEHYVDGSIDNAHIADDAVDTEHLANDCITAAQIDDGAVIFAALKASTVQLSSESFADNDVSIMTSAAIQDKILAYSYGTGDITGVTAGTGLSGGATSGTATLNVDASQTQITAVGTIGTGVWQGTPIANGYLANNSIDTAAMGNDSVDSPSYVDGSIDLAHMSANSVDSAQYVDGSIDVEHLANDSIDEASLKCTNSPTDNYLLSYDSSSSGFTWVVSPSGGSGATLTGSTNNTVCTVTGADAISGEALMLFDSSTGDLTLGDRDACMVIGASHPSQSASAYKIYVGTSLLTGTNTSFEVANNWIYDAMAGQIMVVGSYVTTVKGGIITSYA